MPSSCDHISLGISEYIDDFTQTVRDLVKSRVEPFPFISLPEETDSAWQGIVRAMNDVENIHFNLQGMTKEHFQNWMRLGGHQFEPTLGSPGWTNRELYEILSNEALRKKTIFYNGGGDIDDWLALP